MVLELSLESVFAVVDVFFVSRLGADAVATVGLTESMLTIIYAIAMGLSVGAMATVARRIGEKNPDGAARAAVQAIALGVMVSIPTGIAGGLLAPRLLALMGAGPGVLANTTSYVGLVRIIAGFGSVPLAGYTISIRMVIFAMLPSWGLSNAAATLVGQNLGAGKPERAEASVWRTAFYNMLFLGFVGVNFFIFAPQLVSVFTRDPAVAAYAIRCLRIVSSGFLFYAYGLVLTQSFNGAGDTLTPTLLNLLCFWVFEIPFAYVLSRILGVGPQGAFWAIAVAFSLLAVLSAILFRRGRWKSKRV